MRSQWIEHNGKKVIYQDFSKRFFNCLLSKWNWMKTEGCKGRAKSIRPRADGFARHKCG